MNRRAWKKYFGGQEVEFEDEKNYAEGYNPFKDNNFTQFWDYIERTRKVPRVLNEARLKETLQISHLQERPSSKRNNFAIRSSIFKQ
jgi:hypothetical protein